MFTEEELKELLEIARKIDDSIKLSEQALEKVKALAERGTPAFTNNE